MSSDEQILELQRQMAKMTETMSKISGERRTPTFGEFAAEYMEQKLANPTLRETTKRSFYQQVACHLIPTFGDTPIDKVSNKDFLKWVVSKREDAASKEPGRGRMTRFFNARKYMIEIMSAAKEAGHIEKLPKLDNPDAARSVGRVLAVREVLAILRHTRKRLFRFFFYTLWKMGCRPREVLRWEYSMMRKSPTGTTWMDIPARISKTDRARSIPINPSVARRLWEMFKTHVSPYIFPNVFDPSKPQLSYHGAWATACKKAKVKKAMPYDMRRTFITEKAASGQPMIYVAKVLDTSTKMIESVYAKSQADVMEAIVN